MLSSSKILQTLSPVVDAFLPLGSNGKSSASGRNVFMEEIWKDVADYEGLYQISNLGNVKSCRREIYRPLTGKCILKEKSLAKNLHKWYYMVTMCKLGVHDRRLIHRMVAQHFVPNPFNKPQVNHIDHNPLNNRFDNLEWTTQAENIQHAIKNGRTYRKGESSHYHKLTNEKILAIRELGKTKRGYKKIADKFGLTKWYVCRIVNRKVWNHI